MSLVSQRTQPAGRSKLRRLTRSSIGGIFIGVCMANEPIVRACSELDRGIMSDRMSSLLADIDKAIAQRNFSHFRQDRICIITGWDEDLQMAQVVVMTTFKDQPMSTVDPLSQLFAVSIGDTEPWPHAGAPTIQTTPAWPRLPSYIIAQKFPLDPHQLQQRYYRRRQLYSVSREARRAIDSCCVDVADKLRKHSQKEMKELVRAWDRKQLEIDAAANRAEGPLEPFPRRGRSMPGVMPSQAKRASMATMDPIPENVEQDISSPLPDRHSHATAHGGLTSENTTAAEPASAIVAASQDSSTPVNTSSTKRRLGALSRVFTKGSRSQVSSVA